MKNTPVKDIFFPPRCCGCDGLTERASPVCIRCEKLVLHYASDKKQCDICGLSAEDCICRKKQFFDKFVAAFYYDSTPVKTIFKLKFRARPDIARTYAKLLHTLLEERQLLTEIDIITFIPMRRLAKFRRGYNQSELIARNISELSGIDCVPLLEKIYKTSFQHNLKKTARTGNLLGAFEPVKENTALFENKRVLIVDDVATTGSTLGEAAKTLLIFGADSVYAAACTVSKKSKKNIEHR